MSKSIAVDLGATSGRVIVGEITANSIKIDELHRFINAPKNIESGFHWDFEALYSNILSGIKTATSSHQVSSLGVDSWAVDYGLLKNSELLNTPFHYRDDRNEPASLEVHNLVSAEELYRRNGLQYLPFNTLYQLKAELKRNALSQADQLLLIPDLVNYRLGDYSFAERTNASTTGLLSVNQLEWDEELIAKLGYPRALFPELVDPGTVLGPISSAKQLEFGQSFDLVSVASHDTASAIVAIPATERDFAYISCGTWALVGVELDSPILTPESQAAKFTNELGFGNRIRYLHNVMGLWILSETIRSWEAEGEKVSLTELLAAAASYDKPVAIFDVDHPVFLAPGDMPNRIIEFLQQNELRVPTSKAEFVRSILESLATAFVKNVQLAAQLSNTELKQINIVGGGSQNELLCQLTADLSGLPVQAGPVEATAIGNLLVQANAIGTISGDLESMRALVASTYSPKIYTPKLRKL